jgi:GNAT superfamily N-acetyltransferase
VPPGHLSAVVTHLEMTCPPAPRPAPDAPLALRRMRAPRPDRYRALFRHVGAEWLWQSRLAMGDADLTAILDDDRVEVFSVERKGTAEPEGTADGLLELDFREPGTAELAFLGLSGALVGTGAGRWLMTRALALAWARPIDRLRVHTCTLDHPAALGFYLRSGFRAVRQEVEIMPDPRLTGLLPRGVAPHVPLAVEAAAPAR